MRIEAGGECECGCGCESALSSELHASEMASDRNVGLVGLKELSVMVLVARDLQVMMLVARDLELL